MIMKEDQARLKALLTEAVRVILKNGLRFNQEISVEGLLGITLDNTDVFLININEIIKNELTHAVSSVNQYNNSNNLQTYLPKLLERSSMTNVLGLPLMEGLPSLNINEHSGRSALTKRTGPSLRRRGSSPGTSPAPPQVQPSPGSFCPPHMSNRANLTTAYKPPAQDIDHGAFEPHPKRVHHDVDYGNDLSIAPFSPNINSTNTGIINHKSLNNSQTPDLISGTINGPRNHLDEQGRTLQSERHHPVRNGIGGSTTPGRPHSASSSLSSPLSPPPPPPYSHHMPTVAAAADILSNHGRLDSHNHLSTSSQLPPYQEPITTQAHVNPLPQDPPDPPTVQNQSTRNHEEPIDLLRSPANAQHVVGQLVEFFSKTDQENDFEDKKVPLPSFQSLTKSGGTLPNFSNQFTSLSKSTASNFPSSAAVLGVADPKIQPSDRYGPCVQSPPSAAISPLKIKIENGTKVIEPTNRGRKPKTPKDSPASEFRCEYCGRIFTSWSGRYFHMASHTGKYKHTCFLCKKGFMQTRLYNIHLQSHQKEYEKSHANKSPGSATTDESA